MLLQSIFRSGCAACDRPLDRETALCEVCAVSLWPIDAACPRCALPIEGPASTVCRGCRVRSPAMAHTACPWRYGGELAVALRRLKYGKRPDLGRTLAPLFRAPLAAAADSCDLCVPVPLHWRRESARGFNQARVLLRFGLSRRDRSRLDAVSLRRTRATVAQSGLRATDRERNVRGAFAVTRGRASRVGGARVLLFDDVITTGATLRAAAKALLRAGAREVVGFAIARAS